MQSLSVPVFSWKQVASRVGRVLLILAFVAGSIRLFHAASTSSEDFHVYWRAVHYWFDGVFPYAIRAEDRGFVFKYPPYMLPFLFPFGWFDFDFSRAVWATIELASIWYVYRWLRVQGVSRFSARLGIAMFWYIWLAHFFSGQFTIILLVAALWAFQKPENPYRNGALAVLFAAKVFSLVSLVGYWRNLLRPKVIAFALVLLAIGHTALLIRAGRVSDTPVSVVLDLYRGWMTAAASGASELGHEVVRGTGNHGFVAAILRVLDPYAKHVQLDTLVSVILAVGFGVAWARVSKKLPTTHQWAGWLAYGVIVHPLAWHHSFVLAFPLCVFSIETARLSGRRDLFWLSIFGCALIGLLVPQVVSPTYVKPFELAANKSWGVLISAWAMVAAHRSLVEVEA